MGHSGQLRVRRKVGAGTTFYVDSVSYTHLDVYKRQEYKMAATNKQRSRTLTTRHRIMLPQYLSLIHI